MEALLGPGVEAAKSVGPLFLRQIDYCFRYKKNVENLRRRVKDLKDTRSELQNIVDEDEKNLKSIKKSVKDWFESVDKETTRDETMLRLMNDETTFNVINQQGCNGWCCCRARWNIGRDSLKKMAIINDLLNQGKSFGNNVSDPSPPVGTKFAPTNEDFEDFASRKSSKNQIMVALKDDKTNSVGVYGMEGVGKTMLVNQVHKLVMEEKLFDAVAMTTVSEKVDLKDIQNEISKQLGLKRLEETDNISIRAAMLRKRLMMPNEKFLVILDDLWRTTELADLSDVGIPCRETCKVVITTRSLEVCDYLRCHKNIEVGVLTEKESWHLFKKNAGEDKVNSPALQPVAREIANECGNLPIALVTIGRSLRNKDKTVWIDTADQLKSSNYSPIEDINPKVFKSIKLSYEHLGNEILKKCFLLCSMFPKDHRISIVELMMHVIGDYEILKNMASTLKQVRGRLHTMLDKLMASCLLFGHKEDDGRISKVWMHDIIRYVALKIASEEESGFFAEVGVGLEGWPERLSKSNTSKCNLRVLLMRYEISVLPDKLEVPDYFLCLSFEGNRSLKKIPDSFFQKAESLATLNLSETGISSLPTSLSCLMNLRSLHLGKCALHERDASIIGQLNKLEILNLSGCKLSSLPNEIGEFPNLKLLDLSNNHQLNFIPPNVISRLSRLEELYMFDSFHGWEVEPTGDGSRASLHEVSSLNRLNSLELDIMNDEIKASISFGCVFQSRFNFFEPNSSIIRSARSPICHSIKVLLARVDDLMLSNCTGLKSVGQLVIGDGFNNMKILAVKECNEMKYLMSVIEQKIPTTTFVALEELHLCELNNLKEILHGPMPAGFLDKLKLVEVTRCHGLIYLFPTLAMVFALQQLEELKICYCEGMTGIVAPQEETVLKDQLVLPNLKQLVIKGCKRLKDLYPLTKLSHGGLSQLRRLKVKDCKSLVEILINIDEEKEYDGKAMLPQLQKLSLKNLPSLKTIWKGTIPIGSFQNLRKFKIRNCSDSLKHLIFPVSLVLGGGLSQLEILKINNCKGLKAIIDNHISPTVDGCDQQVLHHQVFPRLNKMVLMNLPNLMAIAKGVIMSFGSFENLEDLWVERCNSLKHLLPIRLLVNGGLPKLKYFYVEECNEMEVIFNEDGGDHGKMVVAFPHLKGLALISLPKLSIFHKGPPIVDWPSLLLLVVSRSENLKRLPLNHQHSLPKLKLIIGDSERWFDEEFEWEDKSFKSRRLRPLFMNIEDDEEGIRRKLKEIKQEFEIEGEEEY